MKENKNGFSSKIGFVLAAAGSAVGLGNLWRFPYLAAKYGGGIFLLVYIILALTFGSTLLITQIAVGRKTGKSCMNAYSELDRRFKPLGWLEAFVPAIILPYYCVIGGWVLKYFSVYIVGKAAPMAADSSNYFDEFIAHAGQPTVFFLIYVILTAAVILLGVQKGIETVSKFLMPVLVIMTIGIAIYTLTCDGALAGLVYYIKPNFSEFSIKTVVAAMGQLFYSLSIAMGIMVTYGSYMRKEDNILSSVWQIEGFDSGIAILAGMIIVPSVFAFSGGDSAALNAGPGLMFVTLPKVFDSMPGGAVVGLVFFLLVALAALTSSISLMETVVHVVMEKWKLRRTPAVAAVLVFTIAVGMLSVLGYSTLSEVTVFGMQFLDFFDFISNNVIMPIVALLLCILVGYVVKPKVVEDELECTGHRFGFKKAYRVMLRYIAPVCLLVIFVSSVFGLV